MYAAVLIKFLTVISIIRTGLAHWGYGSEDTWPHTCKMGERQSPIALSEGIALEQSFDPLIFKGYEGEYPSKLKNNGHSAEVRLLVQDTPSVTGGGLPGVYLLDHLHFHWESEHMIDNYRFPLELHLVHYMRQYGNLTEALKHDDGVAVFSVLFDLSPDDDAFSQPLIDIVERLHDPEKSEEKTFQLKYFLPRDVAGFYRYDGSLTTPPCTEGLIWTVFTNTLPISQKQVDHFKAIKTDERKELPANYRTLQPLHGRVVLIKVSPIRASAPSNSPLLSFMASILLTIYIFIMGA